MGKNKCLSRYFVVHGSHSGSIKSFTLALCVCVSVAYSRFLREEFCTHDEKSGSSPRMKTIKGIFCTLFKINFLIGQVDM